MRRAILLGLLLLAVDVCGAGIRFESPRKQVAMLELFTSHGCSSCPPADVWLREYLDHPELWQQVIPLAFHVDYWD